jgi:hypothetical protein
LNASYSPHYAPDPLNSQEQGQAAEFIFPFPLAIRGKIANIYHNYSSANIENATDNLLPS